MLYDDRVISLLDTPLIKMLLLIVLTLQTVSGILLLFEVSVAIDAVASKRDVYWGISSASVAIGQV